MELVADSYALYVDCCLRIVHSVFGESATVLLVRESQIIKNHRIIVCIVYITMHGPLNVKIPLLEFCSADCC